MDKYTLAMEKVLADVKDGFNFEDKQETIMAVKFLMGFLYAWLKELQDE